MQVRQIQVNLSSKEEELLAAEKELAAANESKQLLSKANMELTLAKQVRDRVATCLHVHIRCRLLSVVG
jgi:hypothetical protein